MQNALRLLVHRFPRAEQRERRQKAGQHEQQQADAVDADEVADAERRNPGVALDELKVRRRRVEPAPQQQRLREHQHRHHQRDVARQRPRRARRLARRAAASAPAIGRRSARSGSGTSGMPLHQDTGRHTTASVVSLSVTATGNTPGSRRLRGTATRRRRGPNRSASAAAARCMPPTDVGRRR